MRWQWMSPLSEGDGDEETGSHRPLIGFHLYSAFHFVCLFHACEIKIFVHLMRQTGRHESTKVEPLL